MSSDSSAPPLKEAQFYGDIMLDSSSPTRTTKYYDEWAATYDNDETLSSYKGPEYVAQAVVDLGLSKDIQILDVLAGTGRLSMLLRQQGFENIDALDGSSESLRIGVERGYFNDTFCCIIGRGKVSPIPDDTYDLQVMSGGFSPGHLYPDSFNELLRIVKPGGYLVWARRAGFENISPQFETFDSEVDRLISEHKWTGERRVVPDYIFQREGILYILRKC